MRDPLSVLRHHVTGAIERGETVAIEGKPMATHNAKGEHHGQFVDRVKPLSPCTALHETFGGRCLNCGFQPAQGGNHGA